MIVREKELIGLLTTMGPYLPIKGFFPAEWLENPLNIALTDGEGNYALFEREGLGLVSGHYFMRARGKQALQLAKEMLHEIFTGPYDVQVIRGLTPTHHKGALWMNKRLGFKSYGTIETTVEPYELVILTKSEWEANQ
jgi:hypothetical protein